MKEKPVSSLITVVFSFLSSILGVLFVPVMLLIICNIIDYITGIIAAKYRDDKKISSYKSMKGIAKKISMWLLVVVGAIVDSLLKYSASTIGYTLPFNFLVACIVAIWLVCNELISILENMADIGIVIPKFLLPIIKNIQTKTESIADQEDSNETRN